MQTSVGLQDKDRNEGREGSRAPGRKRATNQCLPPGTQAGWTHILLPSLYRAVGISITPWQNPDNILISTLWRKVFDTVDLSYETQFADICSLVESFLLFYDQPYQIEYNCLFSGGPEML